MLSPMSLPRLRIVTGKGGVGKTTVATALALAEARLGLQAKAPGVDGSIPFVLPSTQMIGISSS